MQQPPNQGGGGASDELRSDAQHIGSKAADRLHSEVDNRKDQAVGQAKNVSSAMQKAAGELDESSPDWLKSAFRQGADQVQRFADTIESKDSRELMRDAQDFARNNPGTFLAACAAVGFAAARVFKAGGDQPTSGDYAGSGAFNQSQSWGNAESGQQFGNPAQSSQPQTIGQSAQDGNSMFPNSKGSTGSAENSAETGTRAPGRGEFV